MGFFRLLYVGRFFFSFCRSAKFQQVLFEGGNWVGLNSLCVSLKYFFCVCFVFVLVDGLSSHPATTFFFRFFFTFLFTFVIEQMLLALIITHFNSKVWAKCLDQNLPKSNHNFIKINKSHFLILFSIFFKKKCISYFEDRKTTCHLRLVLEK